MQELCPVGEAIQVHYGWAVFGPAELGLGYPEPAGNGFLRERVSTVVGVVSVGADDLPEMAFAECLPDRLVLPEVRRQGGRGGEPITFSCLAGAATSTVIVAGQACAAARAV
ncbi:hypothetical protein GCM10027290_11970 [Micromonospora sonneratiae]